MLILDNLTATQILRRIKFWRIQLFKMTFLAILEVLNLIFSKFEKLSIPKLIKIQSSESLKLPKITFIDRLSSAKLDFT